MGRRKDRGILSDLMEISDALPAVGPALALGLAAVGGYCWWVNPKLMYGLGPVWAILAWLLAALVGGTATGGYLQPVHPTQRPAPGGWAGSARSRT